MNNMHGTTIVGVRKNGSVTIAGDGQVTLGDMAMKQKAVKVRKFDSSKGGVVGGFAGAAADALTLFEKFEQKLDEYEGDLKRSVVEMAKDWRTDKMLRHLEALLLVMDKKNSFISFLLLPLNFLFEIFIFFRRTFTKKYFYTSF